MRAPFLCKASEDETVTWMADAADQVTEETVGHAAADGVALTPAQAMSDQIRSDSVTQRILISGDSERSQRLRGLQAHLGRTVPVLQPRAGDHLPPLLLPVHAVQKVQPGEAHEEQARATLQVRRALISRNLTKNSSGSITELPSSSDTIA